MTRKEEIIQEINRLKELREKVHQYQEPRVQDRKRDPELRFATLEVPKMQYMENLNTQIIKLEKELKTLQ